MMKWFLTWIALIVAVGLIASCGGCALETVAANNKDKAVTIATETWGGKLVAEMVSFGSSVLPNITLNFGKVNTIYRTTPKDMNPELVKAEAEVIRASNSNVSATATGMTQSK